MSVKVAPEAEVALTRPPEVPMTALAARDVSGDTWTLSGWGVASRPDATPAPELPDPPQLTRRKRAAPSRLARDMRGDYRACLAPPRGAELAAPALLT